jgi:CIC family chloride channel protein
VGWFFPIVIGGGQTLAVVVLAGKFTIGVIPLLFAARFLLTISSYATGVAGGIFSPLLALGALFGLAIGQIAHYYTPAIAPEPGVFAVVGMAAYFAAVVRAPLTGVVLIIEMTGDYQLMLPLLVSCFCAYAVAEVLKDLPIYESLLERDLVQNDISIRLREPMVVDFRIEPNAQFTGRKVKSLGLPPGCLIVRCVKAGVEFVPTAQTRLEDHMRITAIIAPEASTSLTMLRNGCMGKRTAK